VGGMDIEKEWLWKVIYQLKDSPRGTRILYPQNMGDIAVLPHGTQILFSIEDATVVATRQAIKHILEKKDGEFLATKTPEIISFHESVYESRSLDRETGWPRILLVKYYPDGKDLFSVIEIKSTGRKSQLVTTARVGKNYLRLLKKIR
jgi:hypothetical protein